MRVIIAAAGTAGHINPGIAIANKIKQENVNSKIIFIGTERGIENDLVPRAGYQLKTIEAYGLSKKISIQNLKNTYKTCIGFKQAKRIIKEFNPDIVIGTGGYICGAVIWQANKLKIPTLLHESNAFPGKAVKILAKKTDKVLVSFKDTITKINKGKNVVCTGTPIKIQRIDYSENEKTSILKKLNLRSDIPLVLIFGGSQGAKAINNSITDIIKEKLNKNYQILLAAGQKQYDEMKETLKEFSIEIDNINNIKVVPYIYNMEEIMNISDLIISRSGAMTITEISNLGKPSILIPLPNVSHNHQYYNAKTLEEINAAKIILNNDLTGKKLNKEINILINDDSKLKIMGQNALKNSSENAQGKIYSEIQKLVKNKKQKIIIQNKIQ